MKVSDEKKKEIVDMIVAFPLAGYRLTKTVEDGAGARVQCYCGAGALLKHDGVNDDSIERVDYGTYDVTAQFIHAHICNVLRRVDVHGITSINVRVAMRMFDRFISDLGHGPFLPGDARARQVVATFVEHLTRDAYEGTLT